MSQGFDKVNGVSAQDAIGKNCRFLQGEASDPQVGFYTAACLRSTYVYMRVILLGGRLRPLGGVLHRAVSESPIAQERNLPPACAIACMFVGQAFLPS